MERNKALRHPPLKSTSPRPMLYGNGWASTLDCQRFLRQTIGRYEGITEAVVENICSYKWLLGVTLCDTYKTLILTGRSH